MKRFKISFTLQKARAVHSQVSSSGGDLGEATIFDDDS
jgi:hypothetical protein